jgi:beta-lactamase regulating signal transducer with metallopeptidase domain
MNMFENLPGHPVMEALGWALVHFLWQGGLIAVLLANIMSCIPRRAAEARYFIACIAMLLMLVSPIITTVTIAAQEKPAPALNAPGASNQSVTGDGMTALPGAGPLAPSSNLWRERLTGLITEWITYGLPWLISTWLAGVLLLSVRLLTGYASVQRLKTQETHPVAERWEEVLRSLRARLGVARPVRLFESELVQVPTAVGWLRPVILLPACALVGLTPRQLEAIIAHELAHIRRHDYLANILQRMIETLLFYHPAVWWVSRQVRIEREYCCDDLAVAACGDALLYARALAEMEEMRAAEPQLAVAANGGPLLNRIRRLAGIPESHSNGQAGLLAGLVALLAMVALVASSRSLASSLPAGQNQKQIAYEKITGAWEGKWDRVHDLTAVEIVVKADGNELSGTLIFYAIVNDGTAPRVVDKIALPLINPRFDGKTLFLKSKKPDGGTFEAELKLTGDDEAEMRVVGEDVPEEVKADVIKHRRVKTRVGDGGNESRPGDLKQDREGSRLDDQKYTGLWIGSYRREDGSTGDISYNLSRDAKGEWKGTLKYTNQNGEQMVELKSLLIADGKMKAKCETPSGNAQVTIEGQFQGDQLEGSFAIYRDNSQEIFEKVIWKATRSAAAKTGK